MPYSRITRNYQVTIPSQIRKDLHLDIGTILDFSIQQGKIVIQPAVSPSDEQSWYWSDAWQAAEAEADQDIQNKDVVEFDSVQDMKAFFDNEKD